MVFLISFFVVRSESLRIDIPGGRITGYQTLYSSDNEFCIFRKMRYDGDNDLFKRVYSTDEALVFYPRGDSVVRVDFARGEHSSFPMGSISDRLDLEGRDWRVDSFDVIDLNDSCRRFVLYSRDEESADSAVVEVCYSKGNVSLYSLERKYLKVLADRMELSDTDVGIALGFIYTPAMGFLGILPEVDAGIGIPEYVEGSSYIGGIRVMHFQAKVLSLGKSNVDSCARLLVGR